MEIIILALAGIFFNCVIRGGLIKEWFKGFRGGDIINALAFAVAAYILSSNIGLSLSMGVGMFIGSMSAIFRPSGDGYIPNKQRFKWFVMVLTRGLVWTVPMALSAMPWLGGKAFVLLVPALFMPLCYSTLWWMRTKNRFIHEWSAAEMTFGAVLWAGLKILIL